MRRMPLVLLLIFLLSGCTRGESDLNRVVKLREAINKCDSCSFTAVITADYADKIHIFKMACKADSGGDMTFEVIEPSTISGITGSFSKDTGMLTFDDQVLMFEMLADNQITPISAPWLLMETLKSGYLGACGPDGENLRIQIDDSYYADTIRADVWVNENNEPVRAEFIWKGKRIVSIDVADFLIV